ncbi:hypothetical protein XCV3111 [Xanthomonas euvesicatoria pv. vesicatoria str. 85-10]|uniref:Uncharacterized protein n=1 Tax=Xanthomonas euvesicatoria pv. vesicatoria (strain 85-10) TaxID=316273 RepID=Q3BQX1_XANE5|nr:hypothetical protein XCV3111 [Xanthomonas euvesicatoria pv. vesicatoria str. 85-10]
MRSTGSGSRMHLHRLGRRCPRPRSDCVQRVPGHIRRGSIPGSTARRVHHDRYAPYFIPDIPSTFGFFRFPWQKS